MVTPVDADDGIDEPRRSFLLLGERRLLHAQKVADGVKIVALAVLLANLLLDELVPVVNRERFGRNHQFVPISLQSISNESL